MAKGTRITLKQSEAQSPAGKLLIDTILNICHDGEISTAEVEDLYLLLNEQGEPIAAIPYLRCITREVLADGVLDETELVLLKKAFERVVPKEVVALSRRTSPKLVCLQILTIRGPRGHVIRQLANSLSSSLTLAAKPRLG